MIPFTSNIPAFLRTPDALFETLLGFSNNPLFAPHYNSELPSTPGLRLHYLDAGTLETKQTFLCLHGNPSWCYIYRKMIPVFAGAGRVIAPDLYGFGRSDKPISEDWHTFDRHRISLLEFITALDLKNITLVVQDWGGIFGLTLPMQMPERFTRLIVMNTAIATGSTLSEGFVQWRAFSNSQPNLDIAKLFMRGNPNLSPIEAAAYNAPYPDITYKAAIRKFPNMVPDSVKAPGALLSQRAAAWWSKEWEGQSFMAVGAADPVLGLPAMHALRTVIRGCPEPMVIPEAGHFVQEWGESIAKVALAYFERV